MEYGYPAYQYPSQPNLYQQPQQNYYKSPYAEHLTFPPHQTPAPIPQTPAPNTRKNSYPTYFDWPEQPAQGISRSKSERSGLATPRKSAMKASASTSLPGRERSNSAVSVTNGLHALGGFTPSHFFLSLNGSNEISLSLGSTAILNAVQAAIQIAWPAGIQQMESASRNEAWRILMRNNPWATSGEESVSARVLLCTIFQAIHEQGFHPLANGELGNDGTPRLVFGVTSAPGPRHFMTITFSRDMSNITLVNAPHHVSQSFAKWMKTALPGKVGSDWSREKSCGVQLKMETFGSSLSKDVVKAYVFNFMERSSFTLMTTVSLPRKGLLAGFNLSSRIEHWMFAQSEQPYVQ